MLELLTSEEMARAEQLAAEAGTSTLTMMENAGRAVAEEVVRRYPRGSRVTVLCGPGNNGGDGFVCARYLRERGYQVRLALLGKQEELHRDPKEMARRWDEAIEPLSLQSLEGAQIIVDAIFGTGLRDDIGGAVAQIIEEVTARKLPVVSVDVPTGIDATRGSVRGIAFKAAATVTFFRRKTGHVLLPGRLYCGDVRAVDIGIPSSVLGDIAPRTFVNDPDFWLRYYPRLRLDGHKYDRGHAVVVSGPMESTGAARLAARAALRSGAGLVTVATSKAAFYINAAQLTAIMVAPFDGAAGLLDYLSDPRIRSTLIGPGAGRDPEVRDLVLSVLASDAVAVLDAEGITAFEDSPVELFNTIKARPVPTIMTPHEGEFRRVFPELEGEVSKLERARRAAELSGAVIILKGADTVVAAPDGLAAISENAPPWLATAGSGDVLAGLVTGLLAQGMAAFDAASAAVWIHGELATTYGPGLIAEDLTEVTPAVLQRLDKRGKIFS
ncbi:NAD(P)H-hydrate dehydratase [Rhodomicrobium lacus]|uniref:NAD(P)H-hydrate dehydratase n=1 Tax=Rhodomicrobium TaxID=1068 RepID=UPI000F8D95EC|nr:NAD(P)H-hydrate dehydratase [Rhodomicrobium lacus]